MRSVRCSRAATFIGVAAIGVACGARTELGVLEQLSDASADAHASHDGATDGSLTDAPNPNDGMVSDAHGDETTLVDVIEECVPIGGHCVSNSDCCNAACGLGKCGGIAPPYGSPPPP